MAACANCGASLPWFGGKTFITNSVPICDECARKAGLELGGNYSKLSIKGLRGYIESKKAYNSFIARSDLTTYCSGYLMLDLARGEFAVGATREDNSNMLNWKVAKLNNMLEVQYYDDIQTVQIQTKQATSGAGKAIVGGILFGGLGAIAGGLMGRSGAEYAQQTRIENCGFVITYEDGTMERFNLLNLLFDYLWVTPQNEVFQQARSFAAAMCEVLYPYTKRAKSDVIPIEAPSSPTEEERMEQLIKAGEMLEKGLLTREEFESLKNNLLS